MLKLASVVIGSGMVFFASFGFAAQPYHAIYDISGNLVKKNSTQEVFFENYWNRVEIDKLRTGVGPFTNTEHKKTFIKGNQNYVVKLKKNGAYNKRGTVMENPMAQHFEGMSDDELEAYGETLYTQLGYAKGETDGARDCEVWTHPQLGEVCLRDKFLMVYMNAVGMSYNLREVNYDFDRSVLDLPDIPFDEVPSIDEIMSGNMPTNRDDYNQEDYDAEAGEGRPKNMQEAMGMIKGLFGGNKNSKTTPPEKTRQPEPPASVEVGTMAAEAADSANGSERN